MEKQNEIRKVKALTDRLTKWYWSPLFPTAYTINGRGLGKLALTNPAAFNLTWARSQARLSTLEEHGEAVTYFANVGSLLDIKVNDNSTTLGSIITLHNQTHISNWYMKSLRNQLPDKHRNLIDQALNETVRKL